MAQTFLTFIPVLDWIALIWFGFCWIGYSLFSHFRAQTGSTLSSHLKEVRGVWMYRALERENRVADVTTLGILQRNVTFFASTTLFILVGLLTVLGATDQAIELVNNLPFVVENTPASWEIKLLLLVYTFVYAFFKFTWSVRQYNFAIVMFGAAPPNNATAQDKEKFVLYSNHLLTRASNSFSFGLRAYSFSMAALAWIAHPGLFIGCSIWVVVVLYRREFHSHSLIALKALGNLEIKKN